MRESVFCVCSLFIFCFTFCCICIFDCTAFSCFLFLFFFFGSTNVRQTFIVSQTYMNWFYAMSIGLCGVWCVFSVCCVVLLIIIVRYTNCLNSYHHVVLFGKHVCKMLPYIIVVCWFGWLVPGVLCSCSSVLLVRYNVASPIVWKMCYISWCECTK